LNISVYSSESVSILRGVILIAEVITVRVCGDWNSLAFSFHLTRIPSSVIWSVTDLTANKQHKTKQPRGHRLSEEEFLNVFTEKISF